jgi:hypothetical protein
MNSKQSVVLFSSCKGPDSLSDKSGKVMSNNGEQVRQRRQIYAPDLCIRCANCWIKPFTTFFRLRRSCVP